MLETSSENFSLICNYFQSLQELEINNKKKYAQLILNLFLSSMYTSNRISA